MSELARPWCCPEPRCLTLSNGANDSGKPLDEAQPGQSFLCFGRMPGHVKYVYDGVEHDNDLNVCFYAATKGMLRFQMNPDDLWLIARDFWTGLRAADPEAFEAWGPPTPIADDASGTTRQSHGRSTAADAGPAEPTKDDE